MDGDKASAVLVGFGKVPSKDSDEDAGALAGKALAKAIKSGDGQSIYEAFESLLSECKARDESDDVDSEEDE